MSHAQRELDRCKAEERAARERLAETMSEIQDRLNPRILLREAWTDLRARGDEAAGNALGLVRSRPGAAAGFVAALAVLILRNPIGRAFAKPFFIPGETESKDDKLNAVTAPGPTRSRRAAASDKGD